MVAIRTVVVSATAGLAGVLAASLGLSAANAAPVQTQITPVAIYNGTPSAFGLAYDTTNTLIWYTQGDSGDSNVHSLKPFNSYTPAQLALLPQVGGVFQISLAAGNHDVAGSTAPAGGAHFRSLAFDSSTGQLVMQGSGVNLQSFDPFTGANNNNGYAGPPNVDQSFSDGLDIDSGNIWYSGDVQHILKNGVELVSANESIPVWNGLSPGSPKNTLGFSGVEQVAAAIWAVAVMSGGDSGRSRTIVSFDAVTGDLLTYDPDGDPVAARWEDMAFDGRYLYAADLRGNNDGVGGAGDIYVFDIVGPGGGSVIQTPEPGALALLGLGLAGIGLLRRRRSS